MSYKVYQIQSAAGHNIGNKKYYNTLGNAKNAAHNCTYRMDKGSKIVELEISETPLSIVNIITLEKPKTNYRGDLYIETTLEGFSDKMGTSNKEVPSSMPTITFN